MDLPQVSTKQESNKAMDVPQITLNGTILHNSVIDQDRNL
jgi:hypothetical protein